MINKTNILKKTNFLCEFIKMMRKIETKIFTKLPVYMIQQLIFKIKQFEPCRNVHVSYL